MRRTETEGDQSPAAARPVHLQWRAIVFVAFGAFLGAPARYAISEALPTLKNGFPMATFLINVSGAFLLGMLLEALARRGPDKGRRRRARLLMGTGFCGAYTTYSTFALDTDQLLRAGQIGKAFLYALGTVLLGLAATVIGIVFAGRHHRWRQDRLVMDPDLWEEGEPTLSSDGHG